MEYSSAVYTDSELGSRLVTMYIFLQTMVTSLHRGLKHYTTIQTL